MELVVDVQGTVDTVKVLSGHPLLVPQAIQAVKEWTFEPVLYEGDNNPIEVVARGVDVSFSFAE